MNHIEQICRVLRVLCGAGATIKLMRCEFFVETIDYVICVIHPGRLELAERIKNAVAKLEQPTIKTVFSSFSGLGNIFGRLVSNFACLAIRSTRKLRQNQPNPFGLLYEKEMPRLHPYESLL